MGSAERDYEIRSSILRNLVAAAEECERLAADASAGEDTESAVDLHMGALRYRQLAARAIGCWNDADAYAYEALTANAAASPETEACDTQEIPRVH